MDAEPITPTPRSIVLIGFMGSGKSTIGRKLHEQLGYEFIDTDQVIEQRSGRAIREIFADEGETAFRDMESALLDELVQAPAVSRVLATGGGIVGRAHNRQALRQLGFVVWLKLPAEEIHKRTARTNSRPLLQTDDPRAAIERLMEQREPLYREAAHLEIETANLDIDEVCAGIVECASYHFNQGS